MGTLFATDAQTLASITRGELVAGEPATVVRGACIDSREALPGCAFVAFAGERVDGHAFVGEAAQRGARAIVVTRYDDTVRAALEASRQRGVAVVVVERALDALQAIGAWNRSRLACPVVGVTGSTGKTTTKDLLAAALAPLGPVTATSGNRNNEIGVPLTLLAAGPDCAAVVVEMAMRGAGQIAHLARMARPTLGLVTNVGVSHMEILGSQEAIVAAKGELVEAVPADGAVFLNGDDAATDPLAKRAHAPIVRYGLGEGCDVRGSDVRLDAEGRAVFAWEARDGLAEITLPMPGRHNVYNALAAAAVASHLGVSAKELGERIAEAPTSDMRMQVVDAASGVTVINDAYNANPTSMRAALRTLVEMRADRRRIAVLGGMAELGSLTELAHFQLGEQVARSGLDTLVTVGELGGRIAEGARAEGMSSRDVRPCACVEEAAEVLDDLLAPGDVVLVKASRAVGLERVVDGIVAPRV